jgi:predicted nucleotidyltransferase
MNPSGPRDHGELIARFADVCAADDRIVAAFLSGSHARGEADAYSDVDLCVIAAEDAYEEVARGREDLVRALGEPLFLEDFGREDIVFFILADGTEGEIFFAREDGLDAIGSGPYRTLVDETGLLAGTSFPWPEPDAVVQEEELRRILAWFWHDLSHFMAAMGRGDLWWAAGQLEALRAFCVNLARIEQNVEAQDEPYEKLGTMIRTTELDALRPTFPPLDREAMLRAASDILRSFQERAPTVARAHGTTYPVELDRLMSARFEDLARASR